MSSASKTFTAMSQVVATQRQVAALKQREQASRIQLEYNDIQGDQISAQRREELGSALSTIAALRAARNTQAAGGAAIEAEVGRRARRGEQIALLGISANRSALVRQIEGLRRSQGPTRFAGYSQAAGTLASAAEDAAVALAGGGG